MWNAFTSAIQVVTDTFSSAFSTAGASAAPAPIVPIKINFIADDCCPPGTPDREITLWAMAYQNQLKPNHLLLWANSQRQLNVAYFDGKQAKMILCPDLSVDEENEVTRDGKKIPLRELKNELARLGVAVGASEIPSGDHVKGKRIDAFLQRELVTDDMLRKTKADFDQAFANMEANGQCSICLEEFDAVRLPHLILKTGSHYHQDCIIQYFQSEIAAHHDLRDPMTKGIIFSRHERPNLERPTFLVEDETYLRMLNEMKEISKNLQVTQRMMAILEKDRKKAAVASAATQPKPATPPGAPTSAPMELALPIAADTQTDPKPPVLPATFASEASGTSDVTLNANQKSKIRKITKR